MLLTAVGGNSDSESTRLTDLDPGYFYDEHDTPKFKHPSWVNADSVDDHGNDLLKRALIDGSPYSPAEVDIVVPPRDASGRIIIEYTLEESNRFNFPFDCKAFFNQRKHFNDHEQVTGDSAQYDDPMDMVWNVRAQSLSPVSRDSQQSIPGTNTDLALDALVVLNLGNDNGKEIADIFKSHFKELADVDLPVSFVSVRDLYNLSKATADGTDTQSAGSETSTQPQETLSEESSLGTVSGTVQVPEAGSERGLTIAVNDTEHIPNNQLSSGDPLAIRPSSSVSASDIPSDVREKGADIVAHGELKSTHEFSLQQPAGETPPILRTDMTDDDLTVITGTVTDPDAGSANGFAVSTSDNTTLHVTVPNPHTVPQEARIIGASVTIEGHASESGGIPQITPTTEDGTVAITVNEDDSIPTSGCTTSSASSDTVQASSGPDTPDIPWLDSDTAESSADDD
jgi:hypothetical protein